MKPAAAFSTSSCPQHQQLRTLHQRADALFTFRKYLRTYQLVWLIKRRRGRFPYRRRDFYILEFRHESILEGSQNYTKSYSIFVRPDFQTKNWYGGKKKRLKNVSASGRSDHGTQCEVLFCSPKRTAYSP